jgi:hypothetical protein
MVKRRPRAAGISGLQARAGGARARKGRSGSECVSGSKARAILVTQAVERTGISGGGLPMAF